MCEGLLDAAWSRSPLCFGHPPCLPIIQGMAGVAAHLPRARMPASALRVLGDDRLFRLAAAGDSRAFEVIYERHHQALYRYCRSIVGNSEDAADALQSTMASALRALAGEQREIALRPWLFRIAHNESVSLLRKRRPHATIDDALELEAPAHDPAVKQRLTELVADLRELPDAQRGALVMHELSGLPYRDVAAALDVAEPHARQLVYEARTALHDIAEGRAMECDHVRRTISDGDRRVMRGRRIRSHLRACSDCAGFEQLLRTRRRDLAAIAPPLPAALAAGVLHKVLGGAGSAGGTAVATSSGGAGLGSMLSGKLLATSAMSKLVAAIAITAAAGAGALEVATKPGHRTDSGASPAAPRAHAAAAKPSAGHTVSTSAPSAAHTPADGGNPGATTTHGKSGSAPGHTKAGGHPVHPTHPVHPVHPVHPTHPVTPARPTHPAHPTHPAPKNTTQKPVTTPAPQTHPTHPVTPVPKVTLPTTTEQSPAVTTPPVEVGGGQGSQSQGSDQTDKSLIHAAP
jgi:RNA polymerase sigma factor (sigma-70 family)